MIIGVPYSVRFTFPKPGLSSHFKLTLEEGEPHPIFTELEKVWQNITKGLLNTEPNLALGFLRMALTFYNILPETRSLRMVGHMDNVIFSES